MDTSAENIIMNSCQYTPVYFIESPSVSQAKSYVITSTNESIQKPVSENLKRFYESSGKLETNLSVTESVSKPRILKKQENNVVGNKLKLASFLLPKSETVTEPPKPIVTPVSNVVLKPVYIANNVPTPTANPVQGPKLDVNSKIVKLKDLNNVIRSPHSRKILPKIKPKENNTANNSKHTSVQLLKLGETYHSLNQLSDDQMKIVNHALKIFNNPQNAQPKPTYDPVTNTKFIYKVVSPKDMPVVTKSKVFIRHKKPEIKREIIKTVQKLEPKEEEREESINIETKVTRSGRIVKLPKNIITEESPNKPKKKNGTVTCHQCTSKFSSPNRLHRHYENNPSHFSTKLHSNLFQCLLAIVRAGPKEQQGNIFVHQLEQLIVKLKSCMPCLLKADGSVNGESMVNEDISRFLGINPGNYSLNMDGLSCVKDSNGYCTHNPAPAINSIIDSNKPQKVISEQKIDLADIPVTKTSVRISTDRRPTIIRKVENRKQRSAQSSPSSSGKKIKLSPPPPPETDDIAIDDIVALLSDTVKTDNLESKTVDNVEISTQQPESIEEVVVPQETTSKPSHIQFHSTHFDIRSSPMKPSSTVFRKFQINPEKMAKYEVQIIRPLQLNQLAQEICPNNEVNVSPSENSTVVHEALSENSNVVQYNETSEQINFEQSEVWSSEQPENFLKPNTNLINDQTDDFLKSDNIIEPALLHIPDTPKEMNKANNEIDIDNHLNKVSNEIDMSDQLSNHSQSIMNFLETLGNELVYPETEIRNNSVDFQLDLFSFNNS